MQLSRPAEAALAFRAILTTGTAKERQDAAYGLALAELNVGLTADAQVAGSAERQSDARVRQIRLAIVSQQILGAYHAGDYADALIYLDARARLESEPDRYDEASRLVLFPPASQ